MSDAGFEAYSNTFTAADGCKDTLKDLYAAIDNQSNAVLVPINQKVADDQQASCRWSQAFKNRQARRLVTSAAVILFCALVSLSTANDIPVRELASSMAAGVLLDAVVVRMLLLPTLVSLFGKANWRLPTWAARLLRLNATTEPPTQDRILAKVGD